MKLIMIIFNVSFMMNFECKLTYSKLKLVIDLLII